MGAAALIAIDWGTTSARAYRMASGDDVRDVRSASLGIQSIEANRYAAALEQLLGDWQRERVPRIACGMIGSRQGWVEAPYVSCPAPFQVLGHSLARTPEGALAVVPGLLSRDAFDVPDVIRGEETQLVGAIAADEARVLAVLPGTHSKWARVERGVIVDFATYMTGELYAVLLAHSILGRMATRSERPAPGAAYARGVTRGLGSGGLAHDIFGARTLALMNEVAPDDAGEWLSGLLIGREIRNARTWAFRAGIDASRVRVIGNAALTDRYVAALTQAEMEVERGPPEAAARGLWHIAQDAGLIG